MSNIMISAFSDEYAVDFEEQLKGMRLLGIKYIEPRHLSGKNISLLTNDEAKEAKALMDKYGIKVSAIGSPLGKIHLDEDMDAHMELARHIFEIADILGTKLVRIFSFYAPEGRDIHEMRDEVFGALGRIVKLAREYNVTLCHENEAEIYGNTPEYCKEIIDFFGGEIKCVFDMGNYVLEQVDPYPDAYELLENDIVYFHIKDAFFDGAIVPPGVGEAKIGKILAEYKELSVNDFFASLEPHLTTFAGLQKLVGRKFDTRYVYPDKIAAFNDAFKRFMELI